jgi:hypothetical protein
MNHSVETDSGAVINIPGSTPVVAGVRKWFRATHTEHSESTNLVSLLSK